VEERGRCFKVLTHHLSGGTEEDKQECQPKPDGSYII